MAKEVMLTTTDNPYDPFTQFEEWFAYDTQQGYNTSGYLARIAVTSDDLPDEINDQAIEDAIDEIVKFNFIGLYKKVTRET